jgi:HPt (histidine-containing phosphotransfer) domain-containing protein
MVGRFLDDFRHSAAGIAAKLRKACVEREEVQARQQAHKLKSSALSVGALALGELCAEMEVAGKAGNTQTLAVLLPLFEQELGAVNAFLDSWLGERAERHQPL